MLKPNELEEKILTKFGYGHGNKAWFTNPEACLVGAASIQAFVQHLNHRLGKQMAFFKEDPERYGPGSFGDALIYFQKLLLDHCNDEAFISIGMERSIDLLELQERRKELPDLKAALKYLEGQDFKDINYGITTLKKAIARLEYVKDEPDRFEEVENSSTPKEIPEDQAWVVPGKKYRNKEWSPNQYFIPSEFNFSKNHWEGTNTIFGILEGLRDGANNRVPYFKNKYAFQAMTSKDEWEECVEPEKPKRLAPAYFYYTNDNDISVSQWLFASKEERRKDDAI